MSVNCGNTVYRAVVIGASAGGLLAMEEILKNLKPSFCLPVLLVQHISPNVESYLATHFEHRSSLRVKEGVSLESRAGFHRLWRYVTDLIGDKLPRCLFKQLSNMGSDVTLVGFLS